MAHQILTVSQMKCFRSCQRKHHYRYDLLYRPVSTSEALYFGTATHAGLETWWNTRDLDAALAAVTPSDGDPYQAVRLQEMLRGYDALWGGGDLRCRAVERQFAAPLTLGKQISRTFDLGGKIDVVVADSAMKLWIVEHKTTSEDISLGSSYWRRLALDAQVSTYFRGARACGYDVSGCIYDVLKKPTIRPHQATPLASLKYTKAGALYSGQRSVDETPEEFRFRLREDIAVHPDKYYARGEVVRLAADEDDAAQDTWDTAKQIIEARRLERYPRNPEACSQWGKICEYFDVCCRVASLDDERLFRQAETAHEELTQGNEVAK